MDNWIYYVLALVAIVVAFLIIKKVAHCMVRTVVLVVLLAALALGYYFLFAN